MSISTETSCSSFSAMSALVLDHTLPRIQSGILHGDHQDREAYPSSTVFWGSELTLRKKIVRLCISCCNGLMVVAAHFVSEPAGHHDDIVNGLTANSRILPSAWEYRPEMDPRTSSFPIGPPLSNFGKYEPSRPRTSSARASQLSRMSGARTGNARVEMKGRRRARGYLTPVLRVLGPSELWPAVRSQFPATSAIYFGMRNSDFCWCAPIVRFLVLVRSQIG